MLAERNVWFFKSSWNALFHLWDQSYTQQTTQDASQRRNLRLWPAHLSGRRGRRWCCSVEFKLIKTQRGGKKTKFSWKNVLTRCQQMKTYLKFGKWGMEQLWSLSPIRFQSVDLKMFALHHLKMQEQESGQKQCLKTFTRMKMNRSSKSESNDFEQNFTVTIITLLTAKKIL